MVFQPLVDHSQKGMAMLKYIPLTITILSIWLILKAILPPPLELKCQVIDWPKNSDPVVSCQYKDSK